MSSSRSDAKAGRTKPRPATETINKLFFTIFLLIGSTFSELVKLSAAAGKLPALRRVHCNLHCVRHLHDALGLGHLVCGAMGQKEKLVGLERRLVFHDAVFGDANAV